jgi:hypothetical protein
MTFGSRLSAGAHARLWRMGKHVSCVQDLLLSSKQTRDEGLLQVVQSYLQHPCPKVLAIPLSYLGSFWEIKWGACNLLNVTWSWD